MGATVRLVATPKCSALYLILTACWLLDDAMSLTLCPSYDMLPALYRLDRGGSLPARDDQPPPTPNS
jgi:hypothetical protein